MFAKSLLIATAAPAFIGSAVALPLIPSHAKTTSDLTVFANAYVSGSTGGLFKTCDSVTAKLGLNLNLNIATTLTTTLSTTLNKWGNTQCLAAYPGQRGLCGEIAAYLAASIYATQRGWAAVEFFAALGVDRVEHWHQSLDYLCGTAGCSTDTCNVLHGHWDGWYHAYTGVAANLYAQEALELKATGLLAAIDTALKATAQVSASANVNVKTNAHAGAVVHRGLGLPGLNTIPKVDSITQGSSTADIVSNTDLLHLGTLKTALEGEANLLTHTTVNHRDLTALIKGSAIGKVTSDLHLLDVAPVKTINEGDAAALANTNAVIHRDLKSDVHAAAHAKLDSGITTHLGSIKSAGSVNAKADAAGVIHFGRDISGVVTGSGSAKVGNAVSAQGEGFASVNKHGAISASKGTVKAGHVDVLYSDDIEVY